MKNCQMLITIEGWEMEVLGGESESLSLNITAKLHIKIYTFYKTTRGQMSSQTCV